MHYRKDINQKMKKNKKQSPLQELINLSTETKNDYLIELSRQAQKELTNILEFGTSQPIKEYTDLAETIKRDLGINEEIQTVVMIIETEPNKKNESEVLLATIGKELNKFKTIGLVNYTQKHLLY